MLTQLGTNPHKHTPEPNPRCVLLSSAGGWLAKCPGASLWETLCLSQCNELTSLPLSWEQCEPHSDRTLASLAQKVQLLQSWPLKKILVAAARAHTFSRYRITQLTNSSESRCEVYSTGMLSHQAVQWQEPHSAHHRNFRATLAMAGFTCIPALQSSRPASDGDGRQREQWYAGCVSPSDRSGWRMTGRKPKNKVAGFPALLWDLHTALNYRWP